MIKPKEISKKANGFGVRDTQIEKDYILSWILYGISKNKVLSKELIFKGGTSLKKIYFKNYRYSEDLDFTLLTSLTLDQLLVLFKSVFQVIKQEANIDLGVIDHSSHQGGGLNFYISYIGPLGGMGSNKKVKVDISRKEKLVFEPIAKDVIIEYSDLNQYQLLCYSIEEIFVEKLRCKFNVYNHEIYMTFGIY